jgi:hypothetical protein
VINQRRDSGNAKNWRNEVGAQAAAGGGNAYTPKGASSSGLAQAARRSNNKATMGPGGMAPKPGSARAADIKGIEAKRRDVNENMAQKRIAKPPAIVSAMKAKLSSTKKPGMGMK